MVSGEALASKAPSPWMYRRIERPTVSTLVDGFLGDNHKSQKFIGGFNLK